MRTTIFRQSPLALLAAAVLATAGELRAALILNGSFEQPGFAASNGYFNVDGPSAAIPGWTVTAGNLALHKSPEIASISNGDFISAQDGDYYLDLSGNTGQHATIFQDFATVPGQSYEVSFFIASAYADRTDAINYRILGAESAPLIDLNLTAPGPSGGLVWEQELSAFVADSLSTRLSFVSTTGYDDNGSFVDDVRVFAVGPTPVPEPSTAVVGILTILSALGRPRTWRGVRAPGLGNDACFRGSANFPPKTRNLAH